MNVAQHRRRRQTYLTKNERRFFVALYVAAGTGLCASILNLVMGLAN